MMHKVLSSASSHFSAAVNPPSFLRRAGPTFHITCRRFFSSHPESAAAQPRTRAAEFPRVDSLIDGCDYKHWLVVMQPPENYPQREELVQQYVSTLALALGSEKAAMESIYSVSTKYYYSFSCQVDENVTHKIKSLPRVKWVLPDSYLSSKENGYGGEPCADGKVVPYDEKYHADWLCDNYGEDNTKKSRSRKFTRRRKRFKKL
ncbi:Multiple organellar RNA editing factor 7-mitochondrial [Striga hermonthica]|uniref:Multiple organellar RNA editing factor 7-mitochondrial n=1 Tax=Striga hermonthica TaxID=68872 RepID=A0A9N7R7A3_STRHE|nr:Multiple organellar RNA editing factor 7-mitochondrial [Striga hermonthica]